MTSYITNNPAIVFFQIGINAALEQLSDLQIGPYLRSHTDEWADEVKELSKLNLENPKDLASGLSREHYKGIIMKLAGVTYNMMLFAGGEFTVEGVWNNLKDMKRIMQGPRKEMDDCSRSYFQFHEEYTQKVHHEYEDVKSGRFFYDPKKLVSLELEKKAVATLFDYIDDEEIEYYKEELSDFRLDANKILAPLHKKQQEIKFLSEFNGRLKLNLK